MPRARQDAHPRAGELLRKAATRESFTDVIRQHAYRGLAEARDDSALGLLAEGMRWGRPTQGRRAAAGALAQLMRGRRDREARDVRERIELLLADRDFRVQAAAIEALAVIGDPAAIAALRRMIDRELDGRLRRRGRRSSAISAKARRCRRRAPPARRGRRAARRVSARCASVSINPML